MTQAAGAMTAGQALELLGLAPDAGADALGRAYRAAVKAAHPDLGGGDPERLRQVIEAHRVLKSLGQARMMFPPSPRPAPTPASAPSLTVSITLREVMAGGRRRLKLEDGKSLDVRLPKGLRAGEVLRLKRNAGATQDLLIRINFKAEAGFTVRGDDLWLEVSAGPDQIRPGARFEIDTPRGRRAVAAPEGAQDGRPIRLKGQGLPARGPHPAGDLILKLVLDPEAAAERGAREPASRKLLRRFSARWAA